MLWRRSGIQDLRKFTDPELQQKEEMTECAENLEYIHSYLRMQYPISK